MNKKKVVVGMSGGVDSSVAALLLKEQGFDVIGVTMQIWDSSDPCRLAREGGCCGQSAVEDARRVADVLGIPYYVMDFREPFRKKVMDYFVEEYLHGRTPNPCIACNRYVKWESLLEKSMDIGADYIATGHYARIEKLASGRFTIRSSAAAAKDQTYALYNLTQFQLAHTLMPVGGYRKEEIRALARQAGLPVADKPDSQEICFISDGDYAAFIDREAGDRVPGEGRFVDADGRALGASRGITHYTVGQRRHLNLSLGHPVFVTEIRPETNEVVVGESGEVFSDTLRCTKLNFMAISDLRGSRDAVGKIRYSHRGAPCRITRTGEDEITAVFSERVRAVTPGQAAVFYDGEHILCGGTIIRNRR